MIQAITNQQIGLNVSTELIIGYALPGRPVAMMMFKTWCYITMAQALTFTSDFKLGHYMKGPPRPMFWGQVIATAIAGTVQLGVQAWMFTNIEGMCDPKQKDGFICPSTEVFGTASIIVRPPFFEHSVFNTNCPFRASSGVSSDLRFNSPRVRCTTGSCSSSSLAPRCPLSRTSLP